MAFSRQCVRGVVTLILSVFLSNIKSGSTSPAYSYSHSGGFGCEGAGKTSNPLIIIMLDGFRWDYYDLYKDSLPNFKAFLDDGVQAEYVDPIFPSFSYPCWTTINTGVFPDVHDISGNQMLDVKAIGTHPDESEFRLGRVNTTKLPKWWQSAEPIWTTATKHKKRCYLRFWSRCDVPYHGVSPEECTGYEDQPYLDSVQEVRDSFELALLKLCQGFDLIMVYGNVVDDTGHVHGPVSPEMKEALIGVDEALGLLLKGLKQFKRDKDVNIIIVGDHGLKYIGNDSGVERIPLDNYIKPDEITRSVDDGAIGSIAVQPNHLDEEPYYNYALTSNQKNFKYKTRVCGLYRYSQSQTWVYNKLKDVEGMKVYKREDIPEKYHTKDAKNTLDLLLEADIKHLIVGLIGTDKQLPRKSSAADTRNGTHGWYNIEDMRTIFFAKGPTFKKGIVAAPIRLEDEYQIFAKLLKIPAQPNNGSWSRVKDMFVDDDDDEDEYEYEHDNY